MKKIILSVIVLGALGSACSQPSGSSKLSSLSSSVQSNLNTSSSSASSASGTPGELQSNLTPDQYGFVNLGYRPAYNASGPGSAHLTFTNIGTRTITLFQPAPQITLPSPTGVFTYASSTLTAVSAGGTYHLYLTIAPEPNSTSCTNATANLTINYGDSAGTPGTINLPISVAGNQAACGGSGSSNSSTSSSSSSSAAPALLQVSFNEGGSSFSYPAVPANWTYTAGASSSVGSSETNPLDVGQSNYNTLKPFYIKVKNIGGRPARFATTSTGYIGNPQSIGWRNGASGSIYEAFPGSAPSGSSYAAGNTFCTAGGTLAVNATCWMAHGFRPVANGSTYKESFTINFTNDDGSVPAVSTLQFYIKGNSP